MLGELMAVGTLSFCGGASVAVMALFSRLQHGVRAECEAANCRETMDRAIEDARGRAHAEGLLEGKLQRADKAEAESAILQESFARAIEEARGRAHAEGMLEGKSLTEEAFWSGFRRELFPNFEGTHSFPLRKKTVITVKDRLLFREFHLGWETVITITLTRELASATELAAYIKGIVAPLAVPIATHVLLGAPV